MRGHTKDTLFFILLAACLMWGADYYLFGGKEAYRAIQANRAAPVMQAAPVAEPEPAQGAEQPDAPPRPVIDDEILPGDEAAPFDFFNEDLDWHYWQQMKDRPIVVPPVPSGTVKDDALSMREEIPPPAGARPKVAIIIDDVGMNVRYSREALALPAPVVMAILPYAPQAAEFARLSAEKGHEILIHTPMEAMSATVSLGGMGLTTDMDDAAVTAMMDAITTRFDGYIGINNHMGSKFTADRASMERLMPYLKARGLIFIDSKTIGSSVASAVARAQGVPNATRDVFLDHEETPEFVRAALARLEHLARRNGHAIAIGHPKAVTIEGLREWLPTLEEKGFDLVPVSALVRRPAPQDQQDAPRAFAPENPVPDPAPDAPPTGPLLLYSPSLEIRY